ncbi:MAG TPA: TetR/AcrR family transcriptional regulator [Acidobacteriota bacterium]|nr:TetR/AcrR family transcriptional regulator [Acidobacteriota bacterium]
MSERKPASRRKKASEETRRLILAAAKQLFTQRGSADVSTRELAAAAGVAEGTIFVHFPDKASLLVAALNDEVQLALEEGMTSMPADGPAPAKLLHVARCLYSHYSKQPALSRILVKESIFVKGDLRNELIQPIEQFVSWAASIVEADKEAGRYDAGVNSETAARTYFSAYFVELVNGLGQPVVDVEEMCSRLAGFLEQWETGLLKRSSPKE